ncbi:MAG: hypothetical protein MHPSP_000108 [Paramarteilia canceri]
MLKENSDLLAELNETKKLNKDSEKRFYEINTILRYQNKYKPKDINELISIVNESSDKFNLEKKINEQNDLICIQNKEINDLRSKIEQMNESNKKIQLSMPNY